VTPEQVEAEEGLDKEEVNAEPDRAAPVAVATEERGVGVTGEMIDSY
jgi:hypothetical protein